MISAVVKGNDLCVAIAVDHLLKNEVRPLHGKLTMAFMNVEAFLRFDPENPTESRYVDEDFNRLWTTEVLDGNRDSVELRRARELRPIVDTVDFLLDIHSMQTVTPPLMMAGPLSKGRRFAEQIGIPETVITDSGHKAGRRMRDYEGFSDPDSPKNALLVECGQHWEKISSELAITSAWRFLSILGVILAETAEPHLIFEIIMVFNSARNREYGNAASVPVGVRPIVSLTRRLAKLFDPQESFPPLLKKLTRHGFLFLPMDSSCRSSCGLAFSIATR